MDILTLVNSGVIAAADSQTLANGIRDFIGPILMLIMGIVAITFLFKREMTQFIIFLVIAVVVAIIFYAPGIIEDLGKGVQQDSGLKGSWST